MLKSLKELKDTIVNEARVIFGKETYPAPAPATDKIGLDITKSVLRVRNETGRIMRRAKGYTVQQIAKHLRRTRARIRREVYALKANPAPEVAESVIKPRLRAYLMLESKLLTIYGTRLGMGEAYRKLTK